MTFLISKIDLQSLVRTSYFRTTTNRQHNGLRWLSLRWLLFLHQSRLPYSRLYLCVLLEILSMLVSTLDSTKSCQPSQTVSDNILLACLLTSTWNTDTFNIYYLVWRYIRTWLWVKTTDLIFFSRFWYSERWRSAEGGGGETPPFLAPPELISILSRWWRWAEGRGRIKTERDLLASPLLAS